MKKYQLKVTFTEPLLGSCPANKDVHTKFIESRKRSDAEARGDEVETLPAEDQEKLGMSVFHRDEQGLFLFDYVVRGFLKEACAAITGKALTAYKSKIDKWMFVFPRRLYLRNEHGTLQSPDGNLERPIRAMTMQGPRISLKSSEMVNPGAHFTAEIRVLPLGELEITEKRLRDWFEYGECNGFGEWRSGSQGRFTHELSVIEA